MPLRRFHVSRLQSGGEVLVMKRMGFLDGQTRPFTVSTDAYDSIFIDQLNPSHAEAMRQLFLDLQGERPRPRTPARLIADDGYVV